jgi:hypothetical protein
VTSLSFIAWSRTASLPNVTSSESKVENKNVKMSAIIESLKSLQGTSLDTTIPFISNVVNLLVQVLTVLDVSDRMLSR